MSSSAFFNAVFICVDDIFTLYVDGVIGNLRLYCLSLIKG